MQHITRVMAASVLNELPASFDTHDIERRILRRYAIAFAEELLEFRATDDPLMRFSAAFSQWISTTFQTHIRKSGARKVNSCNLGGEMSDNQGWTKLNPGALIA